MSRKSKKSIFSSSSIAGIIISIIILVPLFSYILYISSNEPTVKMQEDKVEISAFLSKTQHFTRQEVISIELLDKMPKGGRISGLQTTRHLRGNFNFEGYGASKVFIYRKSPPFIAIKLDSKPAIFINLLHTEDTQKFYQDLINWLA